jgi:hypothetical protein
MTLPEGLLPGHEGRPAGDELAMLHARIRNLLASARRVDHDPAVVLRLDPLLLVASQAGDQGLLPSLRREFGPEAHISVTASGGGLFVMAARSGRVDDVAAAARRRLATFAHARLSGERPGIVAMFIEDIDCIEWRSMRETLELEGETRQFLAHRDARRVVAVTFSSRFELFAVPEPYGMAAGELRFRNPSHPAARSIALAPAVVSSL